MNTLHPELPADNISTLALCVSGCNKHHRPAAYTTVHCLLVWRPELQDRGAGQGALCRGPEGACVPGFSRPLPFPVMAVNPWCPLACRHMPRLCLRLHVALSCVSVQMSLFLEGHSRVELGPPPGLVWNTCMCNVPVST